VADGQRLVDVGAAALVLAEGRADPAADHREGVALAVDLQRLAVTAWAISATKAGISTSAGQALLQRARTSILQAPADSASR